MNLSQVGYFVRAAELLSFSRAAEELYVTQQAVSKAVGALEEEVGARLFLRGPAGLELTQAGGEALRAVRALLAEARALREYAAPGATSKNGGRTVRLAAADVVVGNFLRLDDLLSFGTACGARIGIVEETSDRCVEMVAQGGADLAVVVGSGLGEDLRARRLAEIEFVPFASPEHPLASLPHVDADDLAGQEYLLPRGASESVYGVRACLLAAGATMPARSQFSAPDCNLRTLVFLVCRGGDGLGIIARGATAVVCDAGGVVLPVPSGLIHLPLSLVMRSESSKDELLTRLGHHLAGSLSEQV